ncbi:MAG: oxidoreductase family protein [Acidimicrobiales bacterium]|jgi:aminoglycoside/choline kinase family phosphotransferase
MCATPGVLPIPTSPEEITPAWLTGVLRDSRSREGPVVASVEVEPVGVGVGIMSLLFRLTPAYSSGSGPASVVAKMAPPYEQVRQIAAGYRFYETEVAIYRSLSSDLGLSPPRLYHADHEPATDDFVVVMEDLGHLRTSDQLSGCSIGDARLIVTALARHHARWWQDDRLEALPFIRSWELSPYPQYNDQSCKQSWPVVLDRFGDLIPARIRSLGDRWSEIGPPIMEDMPNHPRTLCHGDVRLDNVFFHDDAAGSVTIVDWQIASASPGSADMGYFMSQSLAVDDRRAHEDELTRLYHETLVEGGVHDYAFEEFWDDYRRAVLFCLCYPIQGGAVELVNDRAVALATSMFERSIAGIIDLDADDLMP